MKKSSDMNSPCSYFYACKGFPLTLHFIRSVFSGTTIAAHDYCELTVHDENFCDVFVENRKYISSVGSIYTFRPGELHYGIWTYPGANRGKSDDTEHYHSRFIMEFPADCFDSISPDRSLLRCFFDRNAGEKNMTLFPEEDRSAMLNRLYGITNAIAAKDPTVEVKILIAVLDILEKLNLYYRRMDDASGQLSPKMHAITLYIKQNAALSPSLSDLSEQFNISVSTIERMFRRELGLRPAKYLKLIRLQHARRLLDNGSSLTQACFESGFGDYSHFIKDFRLQYNVTPGEYQRRSENAENLQKSL